MKIKYTLPKVAYDSIPQEIKNAIATGKHHVKLTEYKNGFTIEIPGLEYNKQNGTPSQRTAGENRINTCVKSPVSTGVGSVIVATTALGVTTANTTNASIVVGAATGFGAGAVTVAILCGIMYCVGKNKASKGEPAQELVTMSINQYKDKKSENMVLPTKGVRDNSMDDKSDNSTNLWLNSTNVGNELSKNKNIIFDNISESGSGSSGNGSNTSLTTFTTNYNNTTTITTQPKSKTNTTEECLKMDAF